MNTAEPNIRPIIEEQMEPAPIVQGTYYRTFDPGEFLTTAEITALVFAATKYIAPRTTITNLRVRDLYSALNKLTALPQSETVNPFN